MLRCALLFVLVGVCTCLNTWEIPKGNLLDHVTPWMSERWVQYKKLHNKTYGCDTEELTRRIHWEDNVRLVESHNKLYEAGRSSFGLGENHFSDLAEDEFNKYYLSSLVIPEDELNRQDDLDDSHINVDDLDAMVDWRTKNRNAVGSVKNQGQCGSCWAYSANGALEGQLGIKRNRGYDLSEQNLVDCSTNGNYGCQGGWMNNAFTYIQRNGIDPENAYPYRGYQQRCRFNRAASVAKVTSIRNIQKGSERDLQSALSNEGPVAIAVDVSDRRFMQYRTGVYDNPYCGQRPSHAMLNIGYGNSAGKDYWLIKNSWSTRWGDNGYIKMRRNRNNQCQMASFASYGRV